MQFNLIIVLLLAAVVLLLSTLADDRRLLTISGTDCRTPKRTRYGLKSRVCNITEDTVTEQPAREALILMKSPKQEVKASPIFKKWMLIIEIFDFKRKVKSDAK